MTLAQPMIRRATPNDARSLAEIVDLAGEGLPTYLWAQMGEPGETVWDVGERRARRDEGSFSYRNAHVAAVDGAVAGGLVGYPLADEPEEIAADFPSMFVPLQELENLACGTWYINVLAVYERFRRLGIGGTLIRKAEAIAAELGRTRTSLIVFDQNHSAIQLYSRCGYRDTARRPIIKNGWACDSTELVLMIKDL